MIILVLGVSQKGTPKFWETCALASGIYGMSWPEVLAQMLMADAPAGTGGSAESVMFLVRFVELNVGNNGK